MDRTVSTFGFWSALTACAAAVGYSAIQTLQIVGLVGHPWDDILIFGFSICIASPFVLAMLALHYAAPEDKKIWSHAGLVFASMYAVLVSLVYMIELGVAIPMTLGGAASEVQFITFRQHSFL